MAAAVALVPIGYLFLRTAQGGFGPWLDAVVSPRVGALAATSLALTAVVTALCLVIGVGAAWLVTRTDTPGRGLLAVAERRGRPLPWTRALDSSASLALITALILFCGPWIRTISLGQVNILRAQSGLGPLALSPQLSAASAAHARDMAAQNRAWHFGSDGSSPLDRAKRQGYFGALIGENISETYENDIQTLNAWMAARDTRDVIMDPAATQLGIGWLQEPTNKIWWVLNIGG